MMAITDVFKISASEIQKVHSQSKKTLILNSIASRGNELFSFLRSGNKHQMCENWAMPTLLEAG